MATYVIGDLQGCFDELMALLESIHFDEKKDCLWFAGDLVNRGPKSLETLRFIKQLPQNTVVVLGNHDLHLLRVAAGKTPLFPDDTLEAILAAPDRNDLINWLRQQPVLYFDEQKKTLLVHAGLAPQWNLATAQRYAAELEAFLRSDDYQENIEQLFLPIDHFQNNVSEWQRLSMIANYFTRIRLCDKKGRLVPLIEGELPKGIYPWYACPGRALEKEFTVVFGHWAALKGTTHVDRIQNIDTGCVWGGSLTALRLDDMQRFDVGCPSYGEVSTASRHNASLEN